MADSTVKIWAVTIILTILLAGCMKDDQWMENQREDLSGQLTDGGLFIVNEGNFMYGNATLSFYNPDTKEVQNDLFFNVNGLPLGDVAQSMYLFNNKGYIVVNNSGRIYIIDIQTGKYTGKITGLVSPRYIHFISEQKAYITDLYASAITVFDPTTNQITGSIPTVGHASTENMIQYGNILYVSCWSADQTILMINTENDQIIGTITTAIQPSAMQIDKNNKLWVICDGGLSNNKKPALQQINLINNTIEKSFSFTASDKPVKLRIDKTKSTLFFINGGVFRMAIDAAELPSSPIIQSTGLPFYGLGVDPKTDELYVSDAIDYLQKGVIYRLNFSGEVIDTFKTGIIPGHFCFKP